jgi:hypothetical protein
MRDAVPILKMCVHAYVYLYIYIYAYIYMYALWGTSFMLLKRRLHIYIFIYTYIHIHTYGHSMGDAVHAFKKALALDPTRARSVSFSARRA